jgi:Coenzyme PQQ synthesis protein D (PqqD)
VTASRVPLPAGRLHRADGVLWREGAFGVVVLGDAAEPCTLEGTGRALWHALAAPVSADALAAGLAHEFGVDRDRIVADIAPVLAELTRIGVIVEEPA